MNIIGKIGLERQKNKGTALNCKAKCVVRFVAGEIPSAVAQAAANGLAAKYLATVAFQIGKHFASRAFLAQTAVSAGQAISCVATCSREKCCN